MARAAGGKGPAGDRLPVLVLGGSANALSIARSLGRYGVRVHAVNFPGEAIRHSRYARWVPLDPGPDYARTWAEFLTGPGSDGLRGSVLLAASDAALKIIAENREALAGRFLLDLSSPGAQLTMLNKLATYQAAAAAGVDTPKFWHVRTASQIEALRDALVFPLIVKPQLSHLFEERFGRKFLVADDFDELRAAFSAVSGAGIDALLVEKIPGPDDRLCSYYTYLDEEGDALFDFTKRVIRRYPVNMGNACYQITDHLPELREPALRLFRAVGLRGLANVEFKRDDRDGRLKLIECNARFTAANALLARCGFDLARFVYNRLAGIPQPPLRDYRAGARLWYPVDDFRAYRQLARSGQLSFAGWVASVLRPQTFPFFEWRDPLPSIVREIRRAGRVLARRQQRASGPPGATG